MSTYILYICFYKVLKMAKSNSNKKSEVKGKKVDIRKRSSVSTKLTQEVGRASTGGGGKPKQPKKK